VLQLGLVLGVLGLHLHEDLQHRHGLLGLSPLQVGLGELGVGGDDEGVVLLNPVDLDQLEQALDVVRVPLLQLLEQRDGAPRLLALEVALGDRRELVEGSVQVPLGEIEPPHLDAVLLVPRVDVHEPAEDPLRVVDPLAPQVRFPELGQDGRILGGLGARFLQEAHSLVEVLLGDVDLRELEAQLGAGLIDLEALLEDLHRLGQVALLVELVGDGGVDPDRLGLLAHPHVQLGQATLELQVGGVDVHHLAEDVGRFPGLPLLQVLVQDDLELALGLHQEALLAVQVGELQVRVQRGGVQAIDLLPDRDRLEQEAVPGVEVRDLRVLLAGLPRAVQLGVEVTDLVDGVPVARIRLQELPVEIDGLVEATGLLLLVGVLLQLDRVDLGHALPLRPPAPGLERCWTLPRINWAGAFGKTEPQAHHPAPPT
jgi:hypothetical protein